jgi:hypothetical protein
MTATFPDTSKTLQFYRLIIFIDIIHLLELDNKQPDLAECTQIVSAICTNLNNEDVLTAYLTSKFGSLSEVAGGAVGAAYVLSNVFPYFTQVLTYIARSDYTGTVFNFAVTLVSNALYYTGLDPTTPSGIINWGIIIYGLFNTPESEPSPKQVASIEQGFLRRHLSRFILKPVLRNARLTVRAFSDAPGGLMRIIKAAKYCAEHGVCKAVRTTAGAACSGAVRTVLGKLVSSDTVRQELLIQLGEKFGAIMTSVDPGKAAEMKCKFIQQFTDRAGADLIRELQAAAIIIDPAKMQAVATGCVSTAVRSTVSLPRGFSVPPPPQRLPLVTLPGGIAKASTPRNLTRPKRTRWDVGDPNKKGGSSKHKKKHPRRSTNKRKLLKSSNRRRSMKHKK